MSSDPTSPYLERWLIKPETILFSEAMQERKGKTSHKEKPSQKKLDPRSTIMGKNCLAEALDACPERFVCIYTDVTTPSSEKDNIFERARALRIAIRTVKSDQLSDLVGTKSHQGFVAEMKPRKTWELKSFIEKVNEKDRSLILVLDSILDPQNFGALLRIAEVFGADGVMYSHNRCAPISPVVTKASVGASELVPIVEVSNLNESLRRLKKSGYWLIAADVGEDSENANTFQFPPKSAIIMGSEGGGIKKLTLEEADFRLRIPMFGKIDSLNVSQATAIFFNGYRRLHFE